MDTLKIIGLGNKIIMVKDNTIKIVKRATAFAARREKIIPVTNVSGVEIKKPGPLVNGYIQIQIAGQMSSNSSFSLTGGAYDVVKDENAVVFAGKENYETALKMQTHILNYRPTVVAASSAPTSDADEILKFKSLLDSGIITQDEFEAKKKQLLGV